MLDAAFRHRYQMFLYDVTVACFYCTTGMGGNMHISECEYDDNGVLWCCFS